MLSIAKQSPHNHIIGKQRSAAVHSCHNLQGNFFIFNKLYFRNYLDKQFGANENAI